MNLRSIFLSSALKRVAMSVFISSTLKTLYRKKQMLISLAIKPNKFSYPLTTITQRKTEGIYVHKLNDYKQRLQVKKTKGNIAGYDRYSYKEKKRNFECQVIRKQVHVMELEYVLRSKLRQYIIKG